MRASLEAGLTAGAIVAVRVDDGEPQSADGPCRRRHAWSAEFDSSQAAAGTDAMVAASDSASSASEPENGARSRARWAVAAAVHRRARHAAAAARLRRLPSRSPSQRRSTAAAAAIALRAPGAAGVRCVSCAASRAAASVAVSLIDLSADHQRRLVAAVPHAAGPGRRSSCCRASSASIGGRRVCRSPAAATLTAYAAGVRVDERAGPVAAGRRRAPRAGRSSPVARSSDAGRPCRNRRKPDSRRPVGAHAVERALPSESSPRRNGGSRDPRDRSRSRADRRS